MNMISLSDLMAEVARYENSKNLMDQKVSVFFLRNFTIETIEPFFKYYLYREGIAPQLFFSVYDNIQQEILISDSLLHKVNPEVIVLSLILENIDPDCNMPNWSYNLVRNMLEDILSALKLKTEAIIVVNTFPPSLYSESGISFSVDRSDRAEQIAKLNHYIKEYVMINIGRFFLIDWQRLLMILGEEESIDYRYWYMNRSPFKKGFLILYAQEIMKFVRALKGKSKKCLVLDCDNTLWGGVIGEDGQYGIKLDRNDYPGNVFYDFQKTIMHLYKRGVILALCSKNNEDDVWEVLDEHPHCLLKRSHLSAWRINWEDKAENISSLARELNIGIDSIVFVDDNPAECERVKQAFPDITVLQVPRKLYTYPPVLLQGGLFDTLSVSREDSERALMYQAEVIRKNETRKFENINDYLASLGLVAVIHPVKPNEISRVAQLTQKTNQFNLTTRRYSEGEILNYSIGLSVVYTLSVRDRFGDYGLTGVFIARLDGKGGVIDTFLLSCRILGRQLESVFLSSCLQKIGQLWDIEYWESEYIPSRKNQQVADFWDRMCFKVQASINGQKTYRLVKESFKPLNVDYIQIVEE